MDTKMLSPWQAQSVKVRSVATSGITLLPHDKVVEITLPAAGGYILGLPKVDEAVGGVYVLHVVGSSGTGYYGVFPQAYSGADQLLINKSTGLYYNSIVLDAVDEWVLLYSDGQYWFAIDCNLTWI